MIDADGGGAAELLGVVDSARRDRAGAVSELLGDVDSVRRARAGAIPQLLGHVDSARRARREQYKRLLQKVAPELEEAHAKRLERDRKEAHRFNVFKYLATHELGLSRMIADLLDPAQDAEHGQGPVFLKAMLDMLSGTAEKTQALLGSLRTMATSRARVTTERWVPCGGYIDITVDIPTDEGQFCLAFENKPYAEDGYLQLSKYLKDLDEMYGGRFLLVYVPPRDREPDPYTLPPEEREHWSDRGQFRVMPYVGGEVSIEGWFAKCRERCEAERLRLYLEDAKSFCRQTFGGFSMTTASETHFIREHLFANRDQMHAALAVHDAWRAVRAEVCERFLRHLCRKVEKQVREEFSEMGDLRVQCHYNDDRHSHIRLWVSRDSWVRLVPASAVTHGRTMIMLSNNSKAPNGWYWGVRNPKPTEQMTEPEKERVEALEATLRLRGLSLREGSTNWWAQCEYLRRNRDWYPLAPDLAAECAADDGTITDYYVDGLLRIARLAIPAIDEVEAARTAAPADDSEPPDNAESPNPTAPAE